MYVPPIILFLVIFAMVLFLLSKIKVNTTPEPEPEKEPDLPLRFYDGPLDGVNSMVHAYREKYYAPFIPEDEDDRETIGRLELPGGHVMEMYKNHWAMYEPVGDEGEYILTKTLTQEEAEELHERGELD